MTPKISVVIPAFNAERYIVETLGGVKRQTVKPHEIIVVNDASRDSTVQVVKGFEVNAGLNIKVYSNERNRGIGFTRQHGAELALGDYVAFLSSDDVWHPNFLEECLPYLDGEKAVFTDYYNCNEALQPFNIFVAPEPSRQNILDWALKRNMFINFSCILLPKDVFGKIRFDEELRHWEDLIFLLDSVAAGVQWVHVPKPLLYYRVHGQQGTRKAKHNRDEFNLFWDALAGRLTALGIDQDTVLHHRNLNVINMFPDPFHKYLRKFRTGIRLVKKKIKAPYTTLEAQRQD